MTVIADTWLELGSGVRPLSNAAGLPLARTVKLVLDPLVIRPAQRPHLGHALLGDDAAGELRDRIREAGADLASTAAWFTMLKTRRRARKITSGSPQDLYFQKAYELAKTAGEPSEAAADAALDEVHDPGRVSAADLREFLAASADRVRGVIDEAWSVVTIAGADPDLAALADDLADGGFDAFDDALERGDGSAAGRALAAPGAARSAGMTAREVPEPPAVGEQASKAKLPDPFDRSILERLFQQVSSLEIRGTQALVALVDDEARRTADPWELAAEESRLVMAAGRAAQGGDGSAGRILDARWQREAFVRHAHRMGIDAREGAREAVMRRLWARLQGRELRRTPADATDAWDLIDGATRSVILDRRDAAKARMGRA